MDDPRLDYTTRTALVAYERRHAAMIQRAEPSGTIDADTDPDLGFVEYVEQYQIAELAALVVEWEAQVSALYSQPDSPAKKLANRTWQALSHAMHERASEALRLLPTGMADEIKAELEQQSRLDYQRQYSS